MVEEPEANDPRCCAELARRSKVLRSRGRVARRVVVGDGERSTITAQHGVEDLADWEEGAVDAAFAHQNDVPKMICGITDKRDHLFASRAPELTHRNGGDVSGGPQPKWNRVACSQSGQTKRRGESGGLFGSDPRESGELLGAGPSESRDAAEVPGESASCLEAVLPALAALQDERNELFGAERVDSAADQTLARGIERLAGPQRGNRA